MRKQLLLKGKKGKARADAVRKEWLRIKAGEFKSEKERFEWENLLKEKSGGYLKTKIGIKNVYKKSSQMIYEDTKRGYELLEGIGIPLAKYKGNVKIKGKERMVFEKCRKIRPEEMQERLEEAIKIIVKSAEKGIILDAGFDNFKVNKEGKLVVIDTNVIKKGTRKHNDLLGNYDFLKEMFETLKRTSKGEFKTLLYKKEKEEENKIKDKKLQQDEKEIYKNYCNERNKIFSQMDKKDFLITVEEIDKLQEKKYQELQKAIEEARKRK